MPRAGFTSGRFGDIRNAQATVGGLPVVNVTAGAVSAGSNLVSRYVNQASSALMHLIGLRYQFNALPIRILDDSGNGGYGTLKISDFPAGYVKLLSAKSSMTRIQASNTYTAGTGLAATFTPTYSFGTVALGAAFASLASTTANIIPSTACTIAAASVSPGGIGRFNLETAAGTAITDLSGGTAGATITSIVTGATIVAATQNAFATLAKELNDLIGETSPTLEIDGSSAAMDLIMNVTIDDASQDGGSDNAITGDALFTGWLEMIYLFT